MTFTLRSYESDFVDTKGGYVNEKQTKLPVFDYKPKISTFFLETPLFQHPVTDWQLNFRFGSESLKTTILQPK